MEAELLKYNTFEKEKMKEHYDELAEKYDEALDTVGHADPIQVTDAIKTKLGLPTDISIIDFGCGTGLAGEKLAEQGYKTITGLDASPGMLEKAKAKGCYTDLREVYCCRDEIPEDLKGKFDVVVSAALMAENHVDGNILDEKL